jgi:hypothetical protein
MNYYFQVWIIQNSEVPDTYRYVLFRMDRRISKLLLFPD